MPSMTPAKATALRKPFPPESIGKLPKGGQLLDFAGHAAVTDRLLAVDPEWTWDFAEADPATGKPSLRYSLDPDGNLWIRLTVCGVSRIGVGDGKNAKERIGDALRNASMRFGVALDLWAKENLVEFAQAAATAGREEPAPAKPAAKKAAAKPAERPYDHGGHPIDNTEDIHEKTRKHMFVLFGKLNIDDADEQRRGISLIVGREVTSRRDLTVTDMKRVIAKLEAAREKANA